jgi:transposase-like protein
LSPNIHIGSDDEKALTKAIDSVFPNSKRSLCTKHMKENVNDYLRNKIGVKTVESLKVMDAIFGEEGILNAE